MVYGNPPFAQIGGGPLPKMNAIADPSHRITYSDTAVPKPGISSDERSHDPSSSAVLVDPTAIDSMKRCLTYRKEQRLTIPELLQHEFLRPQAKGKCRAGTTPLTTHSFGRATRFDFHHQGSDGNACQFRIARARAKGSVCYRHYGRGECGFPDPVYIL